MCGIYTPGNWKLGSLGQLPREAGSPPMRTNWPTDGVGPLRTNIMYHPGGAVWALLGAVTEQTVPAHETAGTSVRCPMLFP